jgi:hypothetical protein
MIRVLIVLFIHLVFVAQSMAAITATLDSGPGLPPVVTENPPGSGLYNVELVRPPGAGSAALASNFSVRASLVTDRIGTITIRSQQAGAQVAVSVGTQAIAVASIDAVTVGSGENDAKGESLLAQCFVRGNFGSADISALDGPVQVGGNVLGPITMRSLEGFQPHIGNLEIAGDLLGNVLVSNGSPINLYEGFIRTISVGGSIGTASNPVALRAGAYRFISAGGDFNATLEGTTAGSYTQYISRVDIGGSIEGVIRTKFVAVGNPRFISCGNSMNGTIVLGGDF